MPIGFAGGPEVPFACEDDHRAKDAGAEQRQTDASHIDRARLPCVITARDLLPQHDRPGEQELKSCSNRAEGEHPDTQTSHPRS